MVSKGSFTLHPPGARSPLLWCLGSHFSSSSLTPVRLPRQLSDSLRVKSKSYGRHEFVPADRSPGRCWRTSYLALPDLSTSTADSLTKEVLFALTPVTQKPDLSGYFHPVPGLAFPPTSSLPLRRWGPTPPCRLLAAREVLRHQLGWRDRLRPGLTSDGAISNTPAILA